MAQFCKPKFDDGDIEFKIENDEIYIYATSAGLKKLIEINELLLNKPRKGHLHLEDYEVLTSKSKKVSIALFD